MLSPEQIAGVAAKALDDKKAQHIKVLKTAEQTVLADYFVICNGTSSAHIKALVGEVDKQLSEAGEPPIRREGLRSDIWVLMDFGSVIVHIFTEEARSLHKLEKLWGDPPITRYPEACLRNDGKGIIVIIIRDRRS
jgi:ribosome-associated protein